MKSVTLACIAFMGSAMLNVTAAQPSTKTTWDGVYSEDQAAKGATLTDVFDRTRVYMPADNVGSLSRDQVAVITAFLLKLNGFPAGSSELSTTAQDLAQIKYVAVKPISQK